ncbi:hypothetical protein [Nannocystis pusilla]|uniref:hypothetical protein n=1 Tax=Nannocystis pusilla TaxID=889268 RepID=UPI003B81B4BF
MEAPHGGEKTELPDDPRHEEIEWPGEENFDGSSERPDEEVEFFAEDDAPISEWIDATSLPTSHIVSISGARPAGGPWDRGSPVAGAAAEDHPHVGRRDDDHDDHHHDDHDHHHELVRCGQAARYRERYQ